MSAAFLLALRVPPLPHTGKRRAFFAELREGWREVRSHNWLWVMMLSTMLVIFVSLSPLQVLGPLAITERQQSPALWGSLTGLLSLGMLAGGFVALYYRPRRPLVSVTLLGLTVSAPAIALALDPSPAALWTVWVLRGVAVGVHMALWATPLQREIPGESLGRVSSWDWMVSGGLWPLGLILAGPLVDVVGLTPLLWLSGVLGIACGLWVLLVKDVRTLAWRPAAPRPDEETAPGAG